MSEQQPKLSKLIISKFMQFEYVEIDFKKMTKINGKSQIAPLAGIVSAFKFILNYNHKSAKYEGDENTLTFVEAHIRYPSGSIKPFRKSVQNNEVVHSIGKLTVTPEKYQDELYASKIIPQTLNTLFLDSSHVDQVSVLTDSQRASFIEFVCGSKQLIAPYNDLTVQISETRLKLDIAVKEETALLVEKRKLKKESSNARKWNHLVDELEIRNIQHDLFKLYHNKKFLETVQVEGNSILLQEAKDKFLLAIEELDKCAQRECVSKNKKIELTIQFDKFHDELLDLQEKCDRETIRGKKHKAFKSQSHKDLKNIDLWIKVLHERIFKLQNQPERNEDLREEYEHLKRSFEISNRFLILTQSSLKSASSEDYSEQLKQDIDKILDSRQEIGEEINSINETLENLESERHEKQLEAIAIEQDLAETGTLNATFDLLRNRIKSAEETNEVNLDGNILIDCFRKAIDIKLQLHKKESKLKILIHEIAFIGVAIERLEVELSLKETEESFLIKKAENNKNKLRHVDEDESRRAFQKELQCVEAELAEKEQSHYKEFCRKIGAASIEDYLQQQKDWLPFELIEKEIESLEKNILSLEIQKAEIEEPNLTKVDLHENLSQELQAKEVEFIQLAEKCISTGEKYFDLEKKLKCNQKVANESIQQVFGEHKTIYTNRQRLQDCMKENYDILVTNFLHKTLIPFKKGSLVDLMVVPIDFPEDYEIVRDSLSVVEVNFDRLEKSLKNAQDVTGKSVELKTKLAKLNEEIDELGRKTQTELSESQLRQINDQFINISKVVQLQKEKFKDLDEKLKKLKEERKKNFMLALENINKYLNEFTLKNLNVAASLESIDEEEPYLGDIVYNWATVDNPDGKVTELAANHLSSLMFLLAIIKLKKQEIVVLNNATAKTSEEISSVLETINGVQVITLLSHSEDDCDFIIRSKSKTFTVVKMK